jgi:hypothetical protein
MATMATLAPISQRPILDELPLELALLFLLAVVIVWSCSS